MAKPIPGANIYYTFIGSFRSENETMRKGVRKSGETEREREREKPFSSFGILFFPSLSSWATKKKLVRFLLHMAALLHGEN